MRFRRRRDRAVTHRTSVGDEGLIICLHGYGGDERQVESLLPLSLPVTTIAPRAPFAVDPGYGWWLPEPASDDGFVELAPTKALDQAIELIKGLTTQYQQREGFGPERTIVVGYSQGATLALEVAARYPDLFLGVVTGAGGLVRTNSARAAVQSLNVLIMNGSLDPVVDRAVHERTVAVMKRAGHRVLTRCDPVPHVIDEAQAEFAVRSIAAWLGDANQRQDSV